jgi:hypothetical protein
MPNRPTSATSGGAGERRPTITHGQKYKLHVDDRDAAGTNQDRKLLCADPFKPIPFIDVPVKTTRRYPKIAPEWRTTLVLAGVIALLCVAIVIMAAMRYF